MKALLAFGAVLLLQSVFLRGEPPLPPIVSDADTLAPGDLDMRKFSFKATPAAGQLVVMREEKFLDGKLKETRESISSLMRNRPFEGTVLVINRSFFSDPDEESKSEKVYQIAGIFREKIEHASLKSIGGGGKPNSVEMEFDTPRGVLKYVISVLVEDYEPVKKRCPDVLATDPSSGWTMMTSYRP